MNVLMFGWEYPPHITGGLATACYGLVQELLKKGHNIKFVIPKADKEIVTKGFQLLSACNITLPPKPHEETKALLNDYLPHVHRMDFQKKVAHKFSGNYGPNLLDDIYWLTVLAGKMAAETEFNVIHAHDWPTFLAGIVAKKISGKPLLVHVHATEFDRSEKINPQVYEIERLGMLVADKVMAVSNFTRNTIINKYKIAPIKVITNYNGVLQKEIKPVAYPKKMTDKIVTFLGRITYQKGPEYFLEAAEKVLKKTNNVRFVMAGVGDLMEKMVQKTASKKMSHHFHYTGYLKSEQVERMLAITDVFVMPSVSEPFGIVPLEAIQANVPVIISRQSGVAEVLPHALTVDYWDTEGLAEAIYGLLNHSSLSNMVRNLNRESLKSLTWGHAAETVSSTYKSMA